MAAITAALVALVMLTDEPGSTERMRIARIAVLSPAVVSVAIWAVLGHASARGELRALAALGARPSAVRIGALSAGWAILALAFATLLVLSETDLGALFPRTASSIQWSLDGLGSWSAPSRAVRVLADGTLYLGVPQPTGLPDTPDLHLAIAAAIGPVAAAVPLWAVCSMPHWVRAATGGGTVLLMLCALHAVAATELHELAPVLVALPLWLGLARRGVLSK